MKLQSTKLFKTDFFVKKIACVLQMMVFLGSKHVFVRAVLPDRCIMYSLIIILKKGFCKRNDIAFSMIKSIATIRMPNIKFLLASRYKSHIFYMVVPYTSCSNLQGIYTQHSTM